MAIDARQLRRAGAASQMHALGITRYEDVDAEILGAIADRVDTLATD